MSNTKQCSDAAQKGPGLTPPVSVPKQDKAPSTGAGSTGVSPNSHQRGTGNTGK